mgnify:CR=1 FL=1
MLITIATAKADQSEAQKAYREFFLARLEQFGVTSPASLTDEVKSEFFSGITEAWDEHKKANNIQTKEEANASSLNASELHGVLEEGRSLIVSNSAARGILLKIAKKFELDEEWLDLVSIDEGTADDILHEVLYTLGNPKSKLYKLPAFIKESQRLVQYTK